MYNNKKNNLKDDFFSKQNFSSKSLFNLTKNNIFCFKLEKKIKKSYIKYISRKLKLNLKNIKVLNKKFKKFNLKNNIRKYKNKKIFFLNLYNN